MTSVIYNFVLDFVTVFCIWQCFKVLCENISLSFLALWQNGDKLNCYVGIVLFIVLFLTGLDRLVELCGSFFHLIDPLMTKLVGA